MFSSEGLKGLLLLRVLKISRTRVLAFLPLVLIQSWGIRLRAVLEKALWFVLRLAGFQPCCMMIKCAFTPQSSEKPQLFSKTSKSYHQTLYTIWIPDNAQVFFFLSWDRLCCETNQYPQGRKSCPWNHHQVPPCPIPSPSFPALFSGLSQHPLIMWTLIMPNAQLHTCDFIEFIWLYWPHCCNQFKDSKNAGRRCYIEKTGAENRGAGSGEAAWNLGDAKTCRSLKYLGQNIYGCRLLHCSTIHCLSLVSPYFRHYLSTESKTEKNLPPPPPHTPAKSQNQNPWLVLFSSYQVRSRSKPCLGSHSHSSFYIFMTLVFSTPAMKKLPLSNAGHFGFWLLLQHKLDLCRWNCTRASVLCGFVSILSHALLINLLV